MAVRLRLKRMGKKKQPTYRVVAADSRSPRDGRIIETLGHYDPRAEPSVISIDTERAVHWLSHGAQPSERVEKLLKITGAWEAFETAKAASSTDASETPLSAADATTTQSAAAAATTARSAAAAQAAAATAAGATASAK